jgi:hypothetical protein
MRPRQARKVSQASQPGECTKQDSSLPDRPVSLCSTRRQAGWTRQASQALLSFANWTSRPASNKLIMHHLHTCVGRGRGCCLANLQADTPPPHHHHQPYHHSISFSLSSLFQARNRSSARWRAVIAGSRTPAIARNICTSTPRTSRSTARRGAATRPIPTLPP